MIFNDCLLIYLVIFTCYFSFELLLNFRQLRALNNKESTQLEITRLFTPTELTKANNYSAAKIKLGLFTHVYSCLILILIVFSGLLVELHGSLVAVLPNSFYLQGLLYLLIVGFLFQALQLPLDLYSVFIIEKKFGFNKLTFKQWLQDLIKSSFLLVFVLTPLIIAILWFVEYFPNYWWLLAYFFIMDFQLTLLFIFPVWIAPLFNKFEKLPEGDLRDKIFSLSEKLAFNLNDIYVMDGSKRSNHGNAYFTGFGKNQRIVLYDTLIQDLKEQELLAVLAHEIGHKKLRHLSKNFIFQAIMLFLVFGIFGLLFNYLPIYQAFGFTEASPAVGLVLCLLLISPVLYFITPLSSMLQRIFEYQADNFAKVALDSASPLTEALVAIYRKNLGNLKPDAWYSFFHNSHPTLVERIKNLQGRQ